MTQFVPFIAYWYIANYTIVPQSYIDNLIAKCPEDAYVKVFHQRAFPYIGKTAPGFCAYLGILFHHRFLTSNTTSQETELWRSLVRLAISCGVCYLFIWQLQFVDWSENIFSLYLNKTVIPCGGAAFLLCSFAETLFEHLGLMNRDYSRKYCVFVHEEIMTHKVKGPRWVNVDDKSESLLPSPRGNYNVAQIVPKGRNN